MWQTDVRRTAFRHRHSGGALHTAMLSFRHLPILRVLQNGVYRQLAGLGTDLLW
jgi:hypothetical protein